MIIDKNRLVEDILKHIDVDNLKSKDCNNKNNNAETSLVSRILRIYALTDYDI
jgi:hypothetical protein